MAVGDATQYARLRRDVGASTDVLPDVTAEEYFVEAQERYPEDSAKLTAYTRVIALRAIRANAAMLGKYAQNQSMTDLTKVFNNLSTMLEEAQSEVEKAADPVESSTTTPYFFGLAQGRRGL